MLLEIQAPPKKAEAKLLRLILIDFLFLFIIFAAAGNAAVILSGIVKFPQVLLLVPAVSILAAIIAFVRFYGYLSNVLRVMGALSLIYDELGGGSAVVNVEFKKPILLFGFLSGNAFTKSKADHFAFAMKTDSAKYQSETHVAIQHGYVLDIRVTDWRKHEHSRSARGKIPQLQNAIMEVIDDVRKDVLESKGVPVQQIVTEQEGYKPVTAPVKTVVPKAVPAPKTPVKKAPSLPPVLEKKAVEQKEKELKAELGKTKKKSEKEALQDVLFQLEEINKIIKED